MTIVAKSNGPMRMCSTDMLYDIMLHISGEGGERETHGDWSEEGGGRSNVQLKTDREQEEEWSHSWEKRGRD